MRLDLSRPCRDSGIGLLSILASLLVLGVVAVAVSALSSDNNSLSISASNTGSSPNSTPSSGPALIIRRAADEAAESNLEAALVATDALSIQAGGYGAISTQSLTNSLPGSVVTAGPSTNAPTISVAFGSGATGGATLAVRSRSGACWLVWRSNASTVYGRTLDNSPCAALSLTVQPELGDHDGVAWRSGTFPSN